MRANPGTRKDEINRLAACARLAQVAQTIIDEPKQSVKRVKALGTASNAEAARTLRVMV